MKTHENHGVDRVYNGVADASGLGEVCAFAADWMIFVVSKRVPLLSELRLCYHLGVKCIGKLTICAPCMLEVNQGECGALPQGIKGSL
jgi:hypothetical protein